MCWFQKTINHALHELHDLIERKTEQEYDAKKAQEKAKELTKILTQKDKELVGEFQLDRKIITGIREYRMHLGEAHEQLHQAAQVNGAEEQIGYIRRALESLQRAQNSVFGIERAMRKEYVNGHKFLE